MQLLLPRLSRFVRICRTGVLLVALSALGAACDRHSATEPPDSYGHGSSHRLDDKSHGLDGGKHHYSDSQGVVEESEDAHGPEALTAPKPGEKPAPAPNPLGIGR